jgi:hypothetical protein
MTDPTLAAVHDALSKAVTTARAFLAALHQVEGIRR